ncbi:hypothetical protein VPHK469_0020 [Vibrio phage K469]
MNDAYYTTLCVIDQTRRSIMYCGVSVEIIISL